MVTNPFVNRSRGLAQGFDVFDESRSFGNNNAVTSEAVTNLAKGYLKSAEKEPFFLWIHHFDPHISYVRHPEQGFADEYRGTLPPTLTELALRQASHEKRLTPEDLEFAKAVYDEEIAHTDTWIGNLVDSLDDMNPRNPTVIIVTSDHGEPENRKAA